MTKIQNTSSDHTSYQTCTIFNSDLIFSANKRNNYCFCTENNLQVTSNSRHLRQCKYFSVARELLLSGDIELNPGPSEYLALTQRLSGLGLSLLDVGGDGDCFFKEFHNDYLELQILILLFNMLLFNMLLFNIWEIPLNSLLRAMSQNRIIILRRGQ